MARRTKLFLSVLTRCGNGAVRPGLIIKPMPCIPARTNDSSDVDAATKELISSTRIRFSAYPSPSGQPDAVHVLKIVWTRVPNYSIHHLHNRSGNELTAIRQRSGRSATLPHIGSLHFRTDAHARRGARAAETPVHRALHPVVQQDLRRRMGHRCHSLIVILARAGRAPVYYPYFGIMRPLPSIRSTAWG